MIDRTDVVAALEMAEVGAMRDLYRAARPETAANLGVSVVEVGNASVLAVSKADVLALNRIMGLGIQSPATDEDLQAIWNVFRRLGSPRFFIPVAPTGTHQDLEMRLERQGVRHYNNWMRLWRELRNLPSMPVDRIQVRRIDAAGAESFAGIVTTAFGFPAEIGSLSAEAIGRPSWSHYLAFEENVPIAAAAMYAAGDAAWFGFAATDARYRKHGAQHALVIRRLHDAAAAGCRWVSVETAEDTVQRDAPSFRNLKRLGFEVAYRRPNYLWTI